MAKHTYSALTEGVPGTVYLLHFSPAYRHAKHYLGWTSLATEQRIEQHVKGNGSPLVKAAIAAGCEVTLVKVWKEVDRHFERKLKRQGGHGCRVCPLCRASHLAARREKRRANERRLHEAIAGNRALAAYCGVDAGGN